MTETKKRGVGVHSSYKEQAKKGCDVLFCVKIKGRATLVDEIPLHMSLKIFDNPKEFDLEEMKEYVNKHNICSPNPKDLTFEPIIFTAEVSKLDYYMLKIEGLPSRYKEFYDHYDHVGNVYKNFMTHVTIDKVLYDELKENGIKAEDVEFGPLLLEHGTTNTVHTFEKPMKKSENLNGEFPIGLHGLMPNIFRKAISIYPDLQKHEKAMTLRGDDLKRYIEDNPELEKTVIKKYNRVKI